MGGAFFAGGTSTTGFDPRFSVCCTFFFGAVAFFFTGSAAGSVASAESVESEMLSVPPLDGGDAFETTEDTSAPLPEPVLSSGIGSKVCCWAPERPVESPFLAEIIPS